MDEADRVVQLMGHTGGKLAEGGHFFGLQQLVLRVFQLAIEFALVRQGSGQLLPLPAQFHFGGNPVGHVAGIDDHPRRIAGHRINRDVEGAVFSGCIDFAGPARAGHLGNLVADRNAELRGQQVEQVLAIQAGGRGMKRLGANAVDGHDHAFRCNHGNELVGAVEHRTERGGALQDPGFQNRVMVAQDVLGLLELQVIANAREQDRRPQRLGDVVGGPQRQPVLLVLIIDAGRYEDHRNVPRGSAAAQTLNDLVAVHLRHHHVEQYQVRRWGLGGDLQGQWSRFGRQHMEMPLQHPAHPFQVDPRIIHDQYRGNDSPRTGRLLPLRGRHHVTLSALVHQGELTGFAAGDLSAAQKYPGHGERMPTKKPATGTGFCLEFLVRPDGIEPPTSTMSTWRSNQLS